MRRARPDLVAAPPAPGAVASRAGLVLLAVFAALSFSAGACGRRLSLPQEPPPPLVHEEVRYRVKIKWTSVPPISDLIVTRNLILYAVVESLHAVVPNVVDSTQVRTYYPERDPLKVNPNSRLADPVVLPRDTTRDASGDTLLGPVRICAGKGNTIWVAYLKRLLGGVSSNWSVLVEFDVRQTPARPTGRSVKDPGIRKFGGITADADSGFVYVADAAANTITKYNPSKTGGRRVTVLATEGTGDFTVKDPRGIYWFQDSLLVADSGKDWIQVLDADRPAGRGVGRGQVAGPVASPLHLSRPTGVWVDAKGFYYVADTGNGRVLKLTRRGEIKENVTEYDEQRALAPVAVTANITEVWIPDPDQGSLTVYEINLQGLP